MRAIVTGDNGFIGSHLTRYLVNSGHSVDGIDLKSGQNIRNYSILDRVFPGIDVVFHLAGLVSIDESMTKPDDYYANNIEGTYSVLSAALRHKVKTVILSSSAAVFKNDNMYSASKKCLEVMGECFSRNIKVISLRYFNVYGPGQKIGLIPSIIKCIHYNSPFLINGNGKQSRDFIYVDDVVAANIQAIKAKSGVYSVGSGRDYSVLEVIKQCETVYNRKIRTEFSGLTGGEDASCAKRKDFLPGWKPKTDLKTGIKAIYENQHNHNPASRMSVL